MKKDSKSHFFRIISTPEEIFKIKAVVNGPQGTPYEGGIWELELSTPTEFPKKGFSARFKTKIFHPNVGNDGAICVDRLKSGWNPSNWTVSEILNVRRMKVNEFRR